MLMWSSLLGIRTSPGCARIPYWFLVLSLWFGTGQCPAQERAADELPRSAATKPNEANLPGDHKSSAEAKTTEAIPPDASAAATKSAAFWAGFPDDIKYLEGPDGKPVAVPAKEIARA